MDPNAFWCITLGTIILYSFWKSQRAQARQRRAYRNTVRDKFARRKERAQREQEIAEVISVVLPTIDNGK